MHSEHEARLFMAGLAYMAVTPDDKLAGSKEFFSFPPSPPGFSISGPVFGQGPHKGVLFFVSSEQYDLFNEELRQIAKQTVFATEYVRLSTVKHLAVIKYILTDIVPFQKQWRKQWYFPDTSSQQVIKPEASAIPVAANKGAALELAVA
ncbi:MAG: hypothetical protein ACPGWR_07925 [Ardenticatenaceae bacterium]